MSFPELLFLAVGLSMDTFAISLCDGMIIKYGAARRSVVYGLYFGAFQAAMPVLGYCVSSLFADRIMEYDHWIAFALLSLVGGKMIIESFKDDEPGRDAVSLKPSRMIPLAVATSIDALAVGVTFAFLQVNIAASAACIGVVTFAMSAVGVHIGGLIKVNARIRASLIGGAVLILIGLKILLEHLGVITL